MRYFVAVLWLVDEHGQLLLARRADHKAHDPSLWGPSVTGKLEPDETVKQALARETQEEIGITPELYQPHFLFEEDFGHPDGVTRRFSVYYAVVGRDKIEAQLQLDPDEVAETKWVTKQDVRELLTTMPGKVIPASAFALWEKVLTLLEAKAVL